MGRRSKVGEKPVRVFDTKTGLTKNFKTMKAFCNKYKVEYNDALQGEINKYRVKKRYYIEVIQ